MNFINKSTIKLDKIKTELDEFAFDFCRILEKHAKYVVISGYVSILFGRARATEDVDIFIEKLDKTGFDSLYEDLGKNGYYCITACKNDAFENLTLNIPIRFAKGDTFIPNIEIKFAKKSRDIVSLTNNLKIITPFGYIYTSYIEQQIAFKRVVLASEKDIEDALHLERVFEGKIDKHKIKEYGRMLRQEK